MWCVALITAQLREWPSQQPRIWAHRSPTENVPALNWFFAPGNRKGRQPSSCHLEEIKHSLCPRWWVKYGTAKWAKKPTTHQTYWWISAASRDSGNTLPTALEAHCRKAFATHLWGCLGLFFHYLLPALRLCCQQPPTVQQIHIWFLWLCHGVASLHAVD